MKKLVIIFIFLSFISCRKDNDVSNNENQIGGGYTNGCYDELTVEGIPTIAWMLEGGKAAYYNWNEDNFYDFGSIWEHGSCGNKKKLHTGWDIKIRSGSIVGKEVYAVDYGKVKAITLASNKKNWGKIMVIEHLDLNNNPYTTNYTHITPINGITEGSIVNKGQKIGHVYNSNIPHLHFSIRRGGYSHISKAGALPRYASSNDCKCNDQPIFPEYFINPALLKYEDILPKPNPPSSQTRIIKLMGDMFFGNLHIGNYKLKTLTIKNLGNSILSINSIKLPYGFTIEGNTIFDIQPNQSREVIIKFLPQSVGSFLGNITVSSNATSGSNTISISGFGVPSSYTVTPNIGTYGYGSSTLYSNCTDNPHFPVHPNMIKLAVTQITPSTITLRMQKIHGNFQNNGKFYLKQDGICGTNLINARHYQIGWNYLENIQIPNNLQPGQTIVLYGLIISNTTDRYYAGPITITRNK